jgi:hypothetical protein
MEGEAELLSWQQFFEGAGGSINPLLLSDT